MYGLGRRGSRWLLRSQARAGSRYLLLQLGAGASEGLGGARLAGLIASL